ncbi:arginine--tRNA ligase [Aureibacillus halotolerans]|uniref:Arginine--tRNA ligase n=1 Tax=Aureibacillus halotolerans TaxID=1508390 RepID=A0A4R6U241_9BACI|nr:arginine--tRNA ligase [Aureibacillus halotolerans]TDQ38763.1 arginyl-tRNA synthetase [Aureibacillus halotolerans]
MSILEAKKQAISKEVERAVLATGLVTEEELPTVLLETPKDSTHGDYATNIAMQLARPAKKAPRAIAESIVAAFNKQKTAVSDIQIAGPGFINFRLDVHALIGVVEEVLEAKDTYGSSNADKPERIQVEFVSANPTGTLHLGHARGAAVGDSLCNILQAAGHEVSREYYINDAGNQVDQLARSIEARYFQALGQEKEMPKDGYHGADIIDIARQLAEQDGESYVSQTEADRLAAFRAYGLQFELDKLKKDLLDFKVPFDEWYSETSLYQNGKIQPALDTLKANGEIYEEEGATWFRSTTYGDDKDRVLIKSDGSYTYLTPDIAYHQDKIERGFSKLINIWGADHHGYIPRMQAAIQALGHSKETLEVEIIQMVNLFENGEKVKMSKRTGNAVTLRELMEDVGVDAMRFFFAMRSPDSHLDFDIDLAKSESNDNPVFYAQYAHARVSSIFKQAEEKGISVAVSADLSLLGSDKEQALLKKVGCFPEVVKDAADKRAPHRITQYVHELASTFHSFYNADKVINPENGPLTQARLQLVKSVQQTLKNALTLVGVNAPERM